MVNTFVALLIMNRATGADSFVGLVEVFAGFFRSLGWLAYPAYAAMLLAITILPLMSAIFFIVLAGMVFGPVKGTVLVSISLSSAAAISAAACRRIAAARSYSLANIDPSATAVDKAIACGPVKTALLLVTLLRLSPVLPFTFSNYLAGLTSLPIWVIFLGTALGTLPTQVRPPRAQQPQLQHPDECVAPSRPYLTPIRVQAIYVGTGALGKQALEGGVKLPKSMLVLGAAATVAAIVLIGHIAQSTLKGMDLDQTGAGGKKKP